MAKWLSIRLEMMHQGFHRLLSTYPHYTFLRRDLPVAVSKVPSHRSSSAGTSHPSITNSFILRYWGGEAFQTLVKSEITHDCQDL